MKKRICAYLLSMLICLSLLPGAMASGEPDPIGSAEPVEEAAPAEAPAEAVPEEEPEPDALLSAEEPVPAPETEEPAQDGLNRTPAPEGDAVLPDLGALDISGSAKAHGSFINGLDLPVRWTLENGVLVITGSGDTGYFWDSVILEWREYLPDIQAVIIGDGITYAGPYSFQGCSNLQVVRLPYDNFYGILECAFADCTSLTSLYMPDAGGLPDAGCGTVGKGAFYNCTSLAAISISVDYYLVVDSYDGCESLEDVYFPSELGWEHWCPYATYFPLPSRQASLNYGYARWHPFEHMPDNGRAWIPAVAATADSDGITGFWLDNRNRMWSEQTGGTQLSWEDVLVPMAMPEGACGDGVTWTTERTEDGGTRLLISGSGAMWDFDHEAGTKASWSEFALGDTEVVVEAGVTSIGAEAFYAFPGTVRSLTVSDSVRSIGDRAFQYCRSGGDGTVDFGDGVETVGAEAFSGFELIHELPKGLRTIGEKAFRNSGLTAVTVPTGAEIGPEAFAACKAETVVIPAGVKSVGDGWFRDCAALRELRIEEGVETIGTAAFARSALTSVSLPDSVKAVGDNAFSGCEALAELSLGSGLRTIGENAFEDCTALERVTLPAGLEELGQEAFGYSGLKEITLPRGIRKLGDRVFRNCGGLESATILFPASLLTTNYSDMGQGLFMSCENLKTLYLSGGSRYIGSAWFSGTGLTDVYFGGTEKDWYDPDRTWERVYIMSGNDVLDDAVIHYGWEEPAPDALPGDCNGDGTTDRKDRIYLARYLAGWDGYGDIAPAAADVNRDGSTDRKDRICLARYLAGWEGYDLAGPAA